MTVTGFGTTYRRTRRFWTNAVGWRWELPTTRALAPTLPRTAGPGPRGSQGLRATSRDQSWQVTARLGDPPSLGTP
eukprot:6195072-Alexandrium_andersonii.AAC.1